MNILRTLCCFFKALLSDYSDYDELLTAMRELHFDEPDAEFIFQDYEHCELLRN